MGILMLPLTLFALACVLQDASSATAPASRPALGFAAAHALEPPSSSASSHVTGPCTTAPSDNVMPVRVTLDYGVYFALRFSCCPPSMQYCIIT